MSKPVEVEFLMKDKLTPGMNKAEREALELRNTVRLLEAELERLRLAGETAAPNLDQSANIAQIHALEKQLEELRGKLKLLQEESESVQVTPADMPNAQRQFNGLHNSIQQMAREMPSLAMGPQMFFLAISNNLPIFTDELARARKEYDELQKSGKKGTPVWKQVLSSLFSWQTAMTTGIMLLVMYGDEIWDWTKNLFSAKKGVDEFNISLKEMTEIEKDGRAQMVRTRFELKSVIDEIKNFTGSKEQEKAKVEELNRKYGESFGYYKTLSEWYDTLIQKSEDYVQVLLHQANVQNLVKKAAEADEEVNKIKAQKPEEAESAMGFFGKWGQYIMQSSMAESGQFYDAQAAIKKHDQEAYDILLKNAENKRDGYLKKAEEEVRKAAEAAKKGNIGGHTDPEQSGKNPEAEAKQRLATERRLAQDLAALQAENRKEEIDRMQAGTEKKLAQIEYDYNARKEEINRQEADWKRENKEAGLSTGDNGLTREQQDELEKARASNTASRKKAEADVYREEAEAMRDYLKEYGTFQQQKLAIAEEYAEKIRKAQSQGERLTLEKQRDAAVHKVDMEALTQKIDWGAAFGDLTGLLADQMKNLLGELKQYVKTDEFKKTGAADQQVVYDAIERIQSMLPGGNGTLDFARLQTQMHALGDAVTRVQNAELQQEAAFIRLKAAQTDYNKALESGNQAEIERTKIALQMAQSSSISADEEYLNATSEMKALAGEVKSVDWKHASGSNFKAEYLYDELAKRKIPAVIMEPLLGGRLSNVPDHIVARLKQREPERSVASWAFRYAGSPQDVLTVLSGMTYMEHLQDNIRTYSPLVPLTEEETQYLYDTADLMMEYPTIPCNDCKYCMPCPYGIDIPAILIHYNKCVNEGNVPESSQDENYRKARRAFLVGYDRSVPKLRQADHCTGCNQCSPHCPQTIDIPKELHRIDKFVEQLKQETL